MFRKRNFLFIGIALLAVFTIAVWLVGLKINATANQMHNAMLKEIGNYRSDLLALDFKRTVEISNSIRDYVAKEVYSEQQLQELLHALVKLDPKVSRIWYTSPQGNFTCIDSTGTIEVDPVLKNTLEKITTGPPKKSNLYYDNGILYWSLYGHHHQIAYGLDVSLADLHAYFASKSPNVRSYAYIVNSEGIIMVHPDENKIGRLITDPVSLQKFHEVISSNKIIQCSGFSQFLLLPVERSFYPITVGNEKWVVVTNTPNLITQEEMREFHRYTFFILIMTVLLFSILLAFSQYKWRKEYDRRKRLEQETIQLSLRQLKNQINPHFLFNSLNSLNAIIGNNPALAQEFVLKLSKIYRYILENRSESFIPVREEIILIRHYYFLQKIRFGEQLRLTFSEEVEVEERKIPFMSLQMLVENAIKHNEITHENPLIIRIYKENQELIVENTYHPRSDVAENSLGIGFENIEKIYEFCSNRRFTYQRKGNLFICRLPLL